MQVDEMRLHAMLSKVCIEGMLFKLSLQALLTGEGKLKALLEIPGIPLLPAQRKQILISQLLNPAVSSG